MGWRAFVPGFVTDLVFGKSDPDAKASTVHNNNVITNDNAKDNSSSGNTMGNNTVHNHAPPNHQIAIVAVSVVVVTVTAALTYRLHINSKRRQESRDKDKQTKAEDDARRAEKKLEDEAKRAEQAAERARKKDTKTYRERLLRHGLRCAELAIWDIEEDDETLSLEENVKIDKERYDQREKVRQYVNQIRVELKLPPLIITGRNDQYDLDIATKCPEDGPRLHYLAYNWYRACVKLHFTEHYDRKPAAQTDEYKRIRKALYDRKSAAQTDEYKRIRKALDHALDRLKFAEDIRSHLLDELLSISKRGEESWREDSIAVLLDAVTSDVPCT